MRVLALDHGEARCGCALSDPTGTLATPIHAIERPDSPTGLEQIVRLIDERDVERVVVGLPLTLAGDEGDQADRAFSERLAGRLAVPVEELPTNGSPHAWPSAREAAATSTRAPAAHLLESYLTRAGAGLTE